MAQIKRLFLVSFPKFYFLVSTILVQTALLTSSVIHSNGHGYCPQKHFLPKIALPYLAGLLEVGRENALSKGQIADINFKKVILKIIWPQSNDHF
jgi:hypothetical protein